MTDRPSREVSQRRAPVPDADVSPTSSMSSGIQAVLLFSGSCGVVMGVFYGLYLARLGLPLGDYLSNPLPLAAIALAACVVPAIGGLVAFGVCRHTASLARRKGARFAAVAAAILCLCVEINAGTPSSAPRHIASTEFLATVISLGALACILLSRFRRLPVLAACLLGVYNLYTITQYPIFPSDTPEQIAVFPGVDLFPSRPVLVLPNTEQEAVIFRNLLSAHVGGPTNLTRVDGYKSTFYCMTLIFDSPSLEVLFGLSRSHPSTPVELQIAPANVILINGFGHVEPSDACGTPL
jgi:hypothetical protein